MDIQVRLPASTEFSRHLVAFKARGGNFNGRSKEMSRGGGRPEDDGAAGGERDVLRSDRSSEEEVKK